MNQGIIGIFCGIITKIDSTTKSAKNEGPSIFNVLHIIQNNPESDV